MESTAKRYLPSFRAIWISMMLATFALQVYVLYQTPQIASPTSQVLLRVNLPKLRHADENETAAAATDTLRDAHNTDNRNELHDQLQPAIFDPSSPHLDHVAIVTASDDEADVPSAIDIELQYKYNETCVDMREHHLEMLFFRPGLCFSRRRVQQILIDLVFTASTVFTQHNIVHFLDSGSLLGAHRHKSVIPYDVDSDMAIDAAGYEYIKHTPIQFPPEYYVQVFDSDIHPAGTRYIELPVRLIHRESALYLDVFVYNDSVDAAGNAWTGPLPAGCFINCAKCPRLEETRWELKLPRDWIYPLKDCRFAKRTLKCPAQTEKYLEYMFGDDYMEPIRYT